jgi:hypothetical protein
MYGDNAYTLLRMLQGYAPNGAAQQKCSEMYNEAIADGPKAAMLTMLGALSDGLKYGNWPWK